MKAARLTLGAATVLTGLAISAVPAAAAVHSSAPNGVRASWTHITAVTHAPSYGVAPALTIHRSAKVTFGVAPALTIHR